MYMVNIFSAAYDLFIIHCRLLIIFFTFRTWAFFCIPVVSGTCNNLNNIAFLYNRLFGSLSAQDLVVETIPYIVSCTD